MTAGVCEGCGCPAMVEERRRMGVKLALCVLCQRGDIIGVWRNEFYGRAA